MLMAVVDRRMGSGGVMVVVVVLALARPTMGMVMRWGWASFDDDHEKVDYLLVRMVDDDLLLGIDDSIGGYGDGAAILHVVNLLIPGR